MNTEQALRASLEVTPPRATIRSIWCAVEMQRALEKAARAIGARNFPRAKALMERAACLMFGIPEETEMLTCTVPEASNEALYAELKKRAIEENDEQARKMLKLKVTAKKKGARRVQS